MTLDKKDIDEIIRLLRKYDKTGDSDFHKLAIKVAQRATCERAAAWLHVLGFIDAQIEMARPTNADIYESLRFINVMVVE